MKIEHLIVTRFSYRNYMNGNKVAPKYFYDPLSPEKLEFRFLLFEMICLPNVLAQVNKDFSWVFIIDKDLGQVYRDRILELTKSVKNVYLHNYNENEDKLYLNCFEDYFSDKADYVITTNLDDDDALTVDYIQNMHEHVIEAYNQKTLTPLKILGAKNICQWDLIHKRKTPLGTISPWHKR
ncbi:MAG: hypothetical protein HRT89_04955, partial [Lentisphaeria bacterium]|nr:hypothetical protein [Lentisphaeria bacterium]